MGRTGVEFTEEFLTQEYVVVGKPIRQIARENHCLPSRVSEQLRAFGIPVSRTPGKSKRVARRLTKEFLDEQYNQLKKTATIIAEEIGIHRDTVCDYLRKHGFVVRRAPGKPRKEMAGRKFGKLKVVAFSHIGNGNRAFWKCKCKCGGECVVSGKELRRKKGGARSCGCSHSDIKHRIMPGALWGRILCGAKARGIEVSVTPEYVEALFERQDEKCALSGRPLTMRPFKGCTGSLDRIDSSRGYCEGNLQWVHKTVNLMKQDFSQDEFIQFCRDIAEHNR